MTGLQLGYACINTQLPSAARTARLANLTTERILQLVQENLEALEAILCWNRDHGIQVFRLTSNLIPFASHPANTLPWWGVFGERLSGLGSLIRSAGMRISTHPGQYIVLSSAHADVVAAAVAELDYHDRLLHAFGLDPSHRIVLHLGAGAADRRAAYDRFAAGFAQLSDGAAARLVLENDERWPLDTMLALAERLRVPVVLDVFHHRLAPSLEPLGLRELVLRAAETWRRRDGRQEVHFSTQAPGKRPGAHAETIDLAAFDRFVDEVGDLPLDCILEVKDKEQSVMRAHARLRARSATDPVTTGVIATPCSPPGPLPSVPRHVGSSASCRCVPVLGSPASQAAVSAAA